MSVTGTARCRMNFLSFVLVLLVILSTEVQADLYSFVSISDNEAVNAAIGALQFSVDVTDYEPTSGLNQVLFTFRNDGPEDAVITKIYFDDDADLLASLHTIFDDPGVYFGQDVKPKNLSAGMGLDPPFVANTDLSVESKKGGEKNNTSHLKNGIDPGESLRLVYDITDGDDFADVITALDLGLTYPVPPGSLRIGIKGQGFDYNDGSESFVHTPAPGAFLLGSIGIGMVIGRLRRKAAIQS